MKTDRELLQLALDVMSSKWNMDKRRQEKALVEEIKAKLAQPEQEPAAWAWYVDSGAGYASCGTDFIKTSIPFARHIPLYTAPPQRKPLTDEEIYLATNHIDRNERGWAIKFARAVIAKATWEAV